MLFPIERLLEGREAPVCVPLTASVREALVLMMVNDYSQLPVVNDSGWVVGVISHETLSRRSYHVGGAVNLMDLTVDHCLVPAETLTPDRDLLEVLDRLKDVYAVVITDGQKPVGILTDYDTTHFFRNLTEDLILVQDIEVTLRHYIEEVWPTEEGRVQALIDAFGRKGDADGDASKSYERLTFHEHVLLIGAERNWPRFRGALEPKALFLALMDEVRQIRNQLAHFRGETDPIQHDALVQARAWLAARPDVNPGDRAAVQKIEPEFLARPLSEPSARYDPLGEWLLNQREEGESRVRVTFADVEAILGRPLPPSAREHRSWWANDSTSHRQSMTWLAAGWQVQDVDLAGEEVEFRRTDLVLMQVVFADLLARLKKSRPGITRAARTQAQNWWSFSAGRSGVSFGWVFDGSGRLRVELYIDTGDKQRNKAAFDTLFAEKHRIEEEIGQALVWERLDAKRASRVFAAIDRRVTDPPESLAEAKQWAHETMLRFVDTFRKRIMAI